MWVDRLLLPGFYPPFYQCLGGWSLGIKTRQMLERRCRRPLPSAIVLINRHFHAVDYTTLLLLLLLIDLLHCVTILFLPPPPPLFPLTHRALFPSNWSRSASSRPQEARLRYIANTHRSCDGLAAINDQPLRQRRAFFHLGRPVDQAVFFCPSIWDSITRCGLKRKRTYF